MKYFVSISTYHIDNKRVNNLELCLQSLIDSGYNGIIQIVDDGSVNKDWLNLSILKNKNINVIEKAYNTGIAKTKNIGLLTCYHNYDGVFLADDDIIFEKDWYEYFSYCVTQSQILHTQTCWNWYPYRIINYNGVDFKRALLWMGYFMYFSHTCIEKFGYFPDLPQKYGYEHVALTKYISQNLDLHDHNIENHLVYDFLHSEKYIKTQDNVISTCESNLADKNKEWFSNLEKITKTNYH